MNAEALIMMVILMILKYLGELDSERTGEDARTQTNLLPATKTASSFTYGTMCDQHDCSTSYSNTSYNYSEDLYDKKLCIICYDEERNSFFVPCGHCATCYDCAKRYISIFQLRKVHLYSIIDIYIITYLRYNYLKYEHGWIYLQWVKKYN